MGFYMGVQGRSIARMDMGFYMRVILWALLEILTPNPAELCR